MRVFASLPLLLSLSLLGGCASLSGGAAPGARAGHRSCQGACIGMPAPEPLTGPDG